MAPSTDNAHVRNRAWIVYPVAAVAATVGYYVLGHNSYLFNVIGLTSPVLILVAVRLHKPERRAPWFLIAAGQFLFIAGDVVSYNYERFNLVAAAGLPARLRLQPGRRRAVPRARPTCCT